MNNSVPPDVWTGLFGLASTLAGAAIGWVASLKVYKSQQNDQMLTSAYSLLTYLQVSYATLVAVKEHIDGCVAESAKYGLPVLPEPDTWWPRVKPMVKGQDVHEFDSNDLVFLARLKEYKLLSDIITVSMRLPAVMAAFELYSSLQPALMRELNNQSTHGSLLFGRLSPEEAQRLLPSRLELHSLMVSVIASLDKDIPLTREILSHLGSAARKYFGRENFPRVDIIT